MYARIVVPLDGSEFGDHAIPFAVSIARRSGGDIELVHVHQAHDEDPYLGGLTPYQFQGELQREFDYERQLVDDERAWLRARATALLAESGVSVTERMLDGRIAGALQLEAERLDADVIVMATHARRGISRWRHGSVGDALVRHSKRPILLVRASDASLERDDPVLRNLLIPLDGSLFSEQILEPALDLARFLGARVTLFHAYWPAPSGRGAERVNDPIEPRAEHAEAYLNSVAERLTGLIEPPEVRMVANAYPAEAILGLLAREAFDMVAMATHGRGGITRMLTGSNADQILSATRTPVFLVRPHSKESDWQARTQDFAGTAVG